jgi:Fe-S-cluster containining protein
MDEFAADPILCRQCGGLCCQGHPGLFADPRQFAELFFPGEPLTPELLRRRLPFLGLELRKLLGVPVPAPRNAPWGCVFLGAGGCSLEPERRPGQCRALIPELETLIDGECRCRMTPGFGTGEVRKNWLRFWREAGQTMPD